MFRQAYRVRFAVTVVQMCNSNRIQNFVLHPMAIHPSYRFRIEETFAHMENVRYSLSFALLVLFANVLQDSRVRDVLAIPFVGLTVWAQEAHAWLHR
jgi:hypothetical protein